MPADNTEAINGLYSGILNRSDQSAEEVAYHQDFLNNGGTMDQLVANFNTAQASSQQTIQDLNASQVTNPVIAGAAQSTATLQTVNDNELLTSNPAGAAATAGTTNAAAVNATAVNADPATQVNPEDYLQYGESASYDAANTEAVEEGVAEQMEVSELSTVQGQYEQLMDFDETPDWAKGAVTAAEDAMAARGLGSSSVAGQAITAALMQSALPIASADANTYFSADLANFDARQQTMLQNLQNRQQNMLTDTAAQNAALQFNAASEQQHTQFMASLMESIETGNANRIDAINMQNSANATNVNIANAASATQVNVANAAQANAQAQFNAQAANQREQFNTEQALVVSQSNATWRRNVNTANTATINATNQINAQNAFNMSTQAQANMWQEFRDEASWANQNNQGALDRAHGMALAAMNRDTTLTMQDKQSDDDYWQTVGQFAAALLN